MVAGREVNGIRVDFRFVFKAHGTECCGNMPRFLRLEIAVQIQQDMFQSLRHGGWWCGRHQPHKGLVAVRMMMMLLSIPQDSRLSKLSQFAIVKVLSRLE